MRLFWLFSPLFFLPGILCGLVDNITVSANPGLLSISTAVAGGQPDSVVNNATTYTVETGLATRRITGRINSNMPTGLTLRIQMQAPGGATSTGSIAMSTTSQNLVTGILAALPVSGLTITYTLQATVSATAGTSGSRTVTYDLIP